MPGLACKARTHQLFALTPPRKVHAHQVSCCPCVLGAHQFINLACASRRKPPTLYLTWAPRCAASSPLPRILSPAPPPPQSAVHTAAASPPRRPCAACRTRRRCRRSSRRRAGWRCSGGSARSSRLRAQRRRAQLCAQVPNPHPHTCAALGLPWRSLMPGRAQLQAGKQRVRRHSARHRPEGSTKAFSGAAGFLRL